MPFNNDVTFDRPVKATLVVKLDNGEQWEAKPEDLKKFGYVDRLDAYMAFNKTLDGYLRAAGLLVEGQRLTDSKLNPLRYLVETAISHPQWLDDLTKHDDGELSTADEIVAIERTLRAADLPAVAPVVEMVQG